MPLLDQLTLLEQFGLRFHEALTTDFIYDNVRHIQFWEFDDPAFKELLENLVHLDYDFEQERGVRLSPQTFSLDLESYDRPTKYSDTAERLADLSGSRHELRLVDEKLTLKPDGSGTGYIEYKFQSESYRHEYSRFRDWMSSTTVLSIARNVSSLDDNFQLYGNYDGQGISFYYMLESEQGRIKDMLDLNPLSEHWRDLPT